MIYRSERRSKFSSGHINRLLHIYFVRRFDHTRLHKQIENIIDHNYQIGQNYANNCNNRRCWNDRLQCLWFARLDLALVPRIHRKAFTLGTIFDILAIAITRARLVGTHIRFVLAIDAVIIHLTLTVIVVRLIVTSRRARFGYVLIARSVIQARIVRAWQQVQLTLVARIIVITHAHELVVARVVTQSMIGTIGNTIGYVVAAVYEGDELIDWHFAYFERRIEYRRVDFL